MCHDNGTARLILPIGTAAADPLICLCLCHSLVLISFLVPLSCAAVLKLNYFQCVSLGVYVCECVSYKNVIILIHVRCLVSYSMGDTSLVELSSLVAVGMISCRLFNGILLLPKMKRNLLQLLSMTLKSTRKCEHQHYFMAHCIGPTAAGCDPIW